MARASAAATVWPASASSGSQLAATASGTGRIVLSPWITSKPNSSGMPRRVSSTAIRCRRSISSSLRDEEKRACPPGAHFGLDAGDFFGGTGEGEILGDLAGLLLDAHLGHQRVDAGPNFSFAHHLVTHASLLRRAPGPGPRGLAYCTSPRLPRRQTFPGVPTATAPAPRRCQAPRGACRSWSW